METPYTIVITITEDGIAGVYQTTQVPQRPIDPDDIHIMLGVENVFEADQSTTVMITSLVDYYVGADPFASDTGTHR